MSGPLTFLRAQNLSWLVRFPCAGLVSTSHIPKGVELIMLVCFAGAGLCLDLAFLRTWKLSWLVRFANAGVCLDLYHEWCVPLVPVLYEPRAFLWAWKLSMPVRFASAGLCLDISHYAGHGTF